jgi:hypothetical protein
MPLPLHRLVLSQGQTPVRLGSIQGGNVTELLLILECRLHCASILHTCAYKTQQGTYHQ